MIRVEGLRKSFGDVRAVDGVDLQVERGELLVLLGQNGAGKSTTLRCLGGILRPDAGLIELDGLRLPEKLDAVRARLGVVPDQARLYGRNTAPEYLDRVAIMRKGVIVPRGTLEDLRREAARGGRLSAHLSKPVSDPEPLNRWLGEHAVEHALHGDHLTYTLPWSAGVADRAAFAAELQRRLSSQDAPFHQLEEEQTSLGSAYLKALGEPVSPSSLPMPAPAAVSGIGAPRMFASLGSQWNLLRNSLPFYVSSWWRRGDL